MNILVVFTGGTIGCSAPNNEGVLQVKDNSNQKNNDYYLLTRYKELSLSQNKDKVTFHTIEPMQVLSENMNVENWNTLISAFKEIDFSKYDGVIITHGSDTIVYTASLFGILFAGLNLPIVFVASNYNLYDERANGHENFESSVDFICNYKFCGTYVIYGYEPEKSIVYLATRIKQSLAFVDRYESVNGIDFGYMEKGVFVPIVDRGNPSIEQLSLIDREPLIKKIKNLSDCILIIKPYIGLNYNCFNLSDIKAVLHETYHSFTVCTEGDSNSEFSLLYLNKRCAEKNISLYLAPFTKSLLSNQRYESTDVILKAKVNLICDVSVECAYAKLLIALNMFGDISDVNSFLGNVVFFENVAL